ncbi:hypothetical protein ACIA5G_07155 [Amycolatopsis sp. NPDC051758]|uniref:hypothetical protein n=1 Tax=Amycolatopsis sp. NPDC051758 TaxID=3363935 RepID=UPI00379E00C8
MEAKMVRMVVGGRDLDIEKEDIIRAMRDAPVETIRKHVVELGGTVYPPKQVLATVTGWDRTSFTTAEAQRVLTRLGFVCRTAGTLPDGTPAWVAADGRPDQLEDRVADLEAALAVAHRAIAGLASRVDELEGRTEGKG